MDPPIHTDSEQSLESSSRMEPTPSVHSSCAHWATILADNDVTLRDAGKKRRGSTGFELGKLPRTTLPAATETFGANVMVFSLGERQSIPSAFTLVEQQPRS